ncbi:TraB/GumN family protein [Sphingomonas baiyangensis]|uniref:TraB/GumN family protein n=1 Tax=Sphingomonas baiyangensis TaxID=2572576 RepID=A0A4U1L4U3_9SPHN|nr:TraB/GumN family protein [Sphingomonas baiyangensis]TKD51205.1 TraB/GumN family protein [Sphingomonas baiyangensis]
MSMILRIGTGLALALAFPAAAPAQQQSAAPAPAPAPAPVQQSESDPALWVVKDADTTIYLFGTIHVLKPGLSWFDDAVRTAFDASDEVVLEMVTPDDAAMQKLILATAVNASGPSLPDKLPADKRETYVQALRGVDLPANAFDRVDPWFAATNLSLLPLMKLGYNPAEGVEMKFTAAAKAGGKPITGLETAEEQIGILDGLPEPAQIGMLLSTIDQLDETQTMIENMVGAWSAGDPDRLAAVMNEGMRDTPEVSKALLADRNARWATWIEQRMRQPGTVFVAVGAGHLAGADSVQTMLAARQIAVERIAY